MLKKLLWFHLAFLLCCTAFPFSAIAQEQSAAIIIDDFGGDVKGADHFLKGDIPVTVAIMPFLEQATLQDEKAHQNGLEVIIHLPLEPKTGKKSWLGPNAITSDLSDEEIKRRLNTAIENVPHAKGLNNHMGSKGMEDERIVTHIVKFAKEHQLYLIDSGTTAKSLMPQLAARYQVPCLKRTLFIDDSTSSYSYVRNQLDTFVKTARNHEYPLAIGHVGVKGNDTYKAIVNAGEQFKRENVRLVYPSEWLYPQIDTHLNQL